MQSIFKGGENSRTSKGPSCFFTCSMEKGNFFYLLNEEGCIVPCEGKKYLRLHFPDSAIFYRLKVRVGKVA